MGGKFWSLVPPVGDFRAAAVGVGHVGSATSITSVVQSRCSRLRLGSARSAHDRLPNRASIGPSGYPVFTLLATIMVEFPVHR
jgi:hypothetical protein